MKFCWRDSESEPCYVEPLPPASSSQVPGDRQPVGLVAELPSNLARGLSGRRDFGPRMGGYSEYSEYSQYPDYPSLHQYFWLYNIE